MNIILAVIQLLKLHVFLKSWQYTDLCRQIQGAEGEKNVESNTVLDFVVLEKIYVKIYQPANKLHRGAQIQVMTTKLIHSSIPFLHSRKLFLKSQYL